MSEYFRHFILPRRSQIGLFHLPFPLLIINLANVFHRSVLAEVSPSVRGLRPSVPSSAPWTRDRRRSHSEEFITLDGDRRAPCIHPSHPMCCSVASRVRGSSSSSAPPAAMLLTVSPRKKVKAIPAAGRRARERASENGSGGGGYGSARPSMVCLAPGVARSL